MQGLVKHITAALFAGALALGSPPPVRANAVHCGRTVVRPGDRAPDVLRKCGPPTGRLRLDGRPQNRRRAPTRSQGGGGRAREVWIYDLGPRQLVRYVSFVGGRVVAIDLGGYGR